MKSPAALAIALLGFGCSSAVSPSPASSEPPSASTLRSSLGSLRTHDREVLLYASPTGMKITVKAAGGAIIADQVDLDALRTLDPQIYDIFRSGVASGRPYLDATLTSPAQRFEARDEPSAAPFGPH
jgi:hypothetical protein